MYSSTEGDAGMERALREKDSVPLPHPARGQHAPRQGACYLEIKSNIYAASAVTMQGVRWI